MRVGCEAQGGTFEAARLPAPRALELVKPDAADRMKRGSGWGNTPRPLVQLCGLRARRASHASCASLTLPHTRRAGRGAKGRRATRTRVRGHWGDGKIVTRPTHLVPTMVSHDVVCGVK